MNSAGRHTRSLKKSSGNACPATKQTPILTLSRGRPKMKHDPINHPAHYTAGKIESIDVIEDWDLDHHLAAVVKYICRRGRRGNRFRPATQLEDLKKARWYLDRRITMLERSRRTARKATNKTAKEQVAAAFADEQERKYQSALDAQESR